MRIGAAGPPGDPDDPRIPEELLALIRAQAARVAEIANEAFADMTLAPISEAAQAQLAAAVAPVMRAAVAHFELALPALPSFALPPGLVDDLARIRESQPPNWPHPMNYSRLPEVIDEDGLPLVWVPRAALVEAVLAAPDRDARVEVLVAHRSEVVEDCRQVLNTITSPLYTGKAALAMRAAEALDAEHAEAAQALAVVVIESATRNAIARGAKTVSAKVKFNPDEIHLMELRLQAALAPLTRFFEEYWGHESGPPPKALNRHMTAHYADPAYVTEAHAVVAVLLAASVLRALQELQEVRAATGEPPWLRP